MGTLHAEGSRRYLEALSTYTRRRMAATGRADVDAVSHIPPALALRQRPGTAGVRSTFGTTTEVLNILRLIFSRLAEHQCPHCGTYAAPTINVAIEGLIGVMHDLLADGNSIVFVDHDVAVIQAANYLVEIGPGAGASGGTIIATGTP